MTKSSSYVAILLLAVTLSEMGAFRAKRKQNHHSSGVADAAAGGDHTAEFTKAHDALVQQLELRKAERDDWLSANDISKKESDLNNKKKQLDDHKNQWGIVRWAKNLFTDKENRLKSEVAILQSELNAMKADKKRLQDELADMSARKDKSKNDAQDTLDGLKKQMDALQTDMDAYTAEKATAQANHDQNRGKMLIEHGAEEDVLTNNIEELQTRIDELKADRAKLLSGQHDLHVEFAEAKLELEKIMETHTKNIDASAQLLDSIKATMTEIDADKAATDAAFEKRKKTLNNQKLEIQAEKEKAESAKTAAEQNKAVAVAALASKTDEHETAVQGLLETLNASLSTLQESQAARKTSKGKLLAAQEAMLKQFINHHAAKIAEWDAKIVIADTEKARLQQEHGALAAAIAAASF